MPPILASGLAVLVLAFGFLLERRRNSEVTAALWVPLVWFFLTGTRFVSQWLGETHNYQSPEAFVEGSPIDQLVFLGLYAAAIGILMKRHLSIAAMISANPWLALFFAYCLLSVAWSDYPWTALKRLVKVTEHVAMVMVVLTEPNRAQALDALLRRFSYVTITISVLFIKYYPGLGRAFSFWTGQPINTGITLDKNALGHICVVAGTLLVSSVLIRERATSGRFRRIEQVYDVTMISSAIWLLYIANAKTALVCFVLATAIVATLAWTQLAQRPRTLLGLLTFGVVAALALEQTFELKDTTIKALNRDPTLTDRTAVWADVLAIPNNPLFGTGFESFWLGERAEAMWRIYWWKPNQAHNGLIETYINLGVVGVLALLGAIIAGFRRILRNLPADPRLGAVRLALLLAILLFNYTDATFKALHALYFVFFVVVAAYPLRIDPKLQRLQPHVPKPRRQARAESARKSV